MPAYQSNSPHTNTDWLTPPEIIQILGDFDLDPCTPAHMPWKTAKSRWTPADDGLRQPWLGRVWLNPPYGPHTAAWMEKMCEHDNGIALIPARTETRMFYNFVWGHASGVCFIRGRLRFFHPDGRRAKQTINAPTALIAYGEDNLTALLRSGLGVVVKEIHGK